MHVKHHDLDDEDEIKEKKTKKKKKKKEMMKMNMMLSIYIYTSAHHQQCLFVLVLIRFCSIFHPILFPLCFEAFLLVSYVSLFFCQSRCAIAELHIS